MPSPEPDSRAAPAPGPERAEPDGARPGRADQSGEPSRLAEQHSAPPGLDRKLVPLYDEAVAAADVSPASACALARLLLRSLIQSQGLRGRHLVRDISELVSAGAPVGLLRALDVMKLSETEARRPGEINLANGHGDAQNLMMFIHLFTEHVSARER